MQATDFEPKGVSSPETDLIISVIVIGSDGFQQLRHGGLVFRVSQCEGHGGVYLPVDHLVTQCRQEDHQLYGIHVMCDHHQLRLLVLQQGGDAIDPCSKDRGSLGGDIPFVSSLLLRSANTL